MKLTHRIALAAAGLALTGSGVYIGATTPTPFDRVEAPTPAVSQTIPPVLQVATSEDDPRWNCETQGNRRCGITDPAMSRTAWKVWDGYGGAERLLVDPGQRVTLGGYATADPYAADGPDLGTNEVALHDSGVWYIFRAEHY